MRAMSIFISLIADMCLISKGRLLLLRRIEFAAIALGLLGLILSGCASGPPSKSSQRTSDQQTAINRTTKGTVPHYKVGKPYKIDGRTYRPAVDRRYTEIGIASWYGPKFHGRPTANGELFDMAALTAAHRTLPLPSIAEVTNLANNRKIIVRINDRGPFSKERIIDLSRAAAQKLDFIQQGTTRVRVRYLREATLDVALLRTGDRRAIAQLERELKNRRSTRRHEQREKQLQAPHSDNDPISSLILRSVNERSTQADHVGTGQIATIGQATRDQRPPFSRQAGSQIPARTMPQSLHRGPFRIQIGAYSDPNRAELIRFQLGSAVSVDTDELIYPDGRVVFRVFAGGFNSRDQALSYLPSARAAGYPDAFVVEIKGYRAQY